ncbi:p21-C-terminal region-binding protein-domain-containing protein [Syncephalastrum racemosum]|uniref:Protein BCP1 n=1 Tax=Syncephalastrum racemosum TaxID=13706 RepID=A0A1X2HW54_SYNRA|nr:p21-C-terminal region-binding protein-domain-containing protein [Syncephalastrum racemosum]
MKRKAPEEEVKQVESDDDDEGSIGNVQDVVDVDFDFFNPESVDYHALKRLLNQLFSSDAEDLNVGEIVDIMLEENHVGTTVKVDGQESDPYAILTTINMQDKKDNAGIKALRTYLLNKCPKKEQEAVEAILAPTSPKHVGWVVSERFINMPMEIMPPMYTMMQDELKEAAKKGEAYTFEWYMFITKTYKEVESALDEENNDEEEEEEDQQRKKAKKNGKQPVMSSETFYFQPEDEIIAKYAERHFDFKFTNREKESTSDAKRAFSDFGIAPSRRLLFVHHTKFDALVQDIESQCSNNAQ